MGGSDSNPERHLEEWVIPVELLIACVPDKEPFALKGGEVINSGEEEQVEILGGVRPWDKASWQNMSLLVAVTWSEIKNDPDVYPAIRLLVSIQLCAIRREHQDGIVGFKMWRNVVEIVLALGVVRKDVR